MCHSNQYRGSIPTLSGGSSEGSSAPPIPLEPQDTWDTSEALSLTAGTAFTTSIAEKPDGGTYAAPLLDPLYYHPPQQQDSGPSMFHAIRQHCDSQNAKGALLDVPGIHCVPDGCHSLLAGSRSQTCSFSPTPTITSGGSAESRVESYTPISCGGAYGLTECVEDTVEPRATQAVIPIGLEDGLGLGNDLTSTSPNIGKRPGFRKLANRRSSQKPRRTQPKQVGVHGVKEIPEAKFFCNKNKCKQKFARAEHLKRHKLTTHSKEKSFACPVARLFGARYCSMKANRKDNLKQHIITHIKSDTDVPKQRNGVIEVSVLLRCLEVVDRVDLKKDLTDEDRKELIQKLRKALGKKPTKSEPRQHIEHELMEKIGFQCGQNAEEHPVGDIIDVIKWGKGPDGRPQTKEKVVRVGRLCGCGSNFPEPSECKKADAPPTGPAVFDFLAQATPRSGPMMQIRSHI